MGLGGSAAPPKPLLTVPVPNVTAHPSTASVPITALLYNGPLLRGFNVPFYHQPRTVPGLIGSKPTSLSASTHDSPPRTIEECNYLLTYLLTLLKELSCCHKYDATTIRGCYKEATISLRFLCNTLQHYEE